MKLSIGQIITAIIIVLVTILGASAQSTQQYSKMYISPYYRSSMSSGTNYTYTLTVNPQDNIKKVLNAMISFSIYITPTVNYDLWVNNKRCNPSTFTISTTYASAGLGSLSFDCSNIINGAGTYTIKLKSDKNSGSSYAWLDLTYINDPSTATFHGTEYKAGDAGKVWLQLLDGSNNVINNATCFLDIYYPSSVKFTERTQMSFLADGLYYKDFMIPSVLGVYPTIGICYYNTISNNYNSSSGFVKVGTSFLNDYTATWFDDSSRWQIDEVLVSGVYRISVNFTINNIQNGLYPTDINIHFVGQWDTLAGDNGNTVIVQAYNFSSNKWKSLPNQILDTNSVDVIINNNIVVPNFNLTKSGFVKNGIAYIRFNDTSIADSQKTRFKINQVLLQVIQLNGGQWHETRGSSEIHVSSGGSSGTIVNNLFSAYSLCGNEEQDCGYFVNSSGFGSSGSFTAEGLVIDNITFVNINSQIVNSNYKYYTGTSEDCTSVLNIYQYKNGIKTDIFNQTIMNVFGVDSCKIDIPVSFLANESIYKISIVRDNYMKWELMLYNDLIQIINKTVSSACYSLPFVFNLPINHSFSTTELNIMNGTYVGCYRTLDNLWYFNYFYDLSKSAYITGDYASYLTEGRLYYSLLDASYVNINTYLRNINQISILAYVTNISGYTKNVIPILKSMNLTTNNINSYLQSTIFSAIQQNQNYLLKILNNETFEINQIDVIRNNLTTINNNILMMTNLLQGVNNSVMDAISINRVKINNLQLIINQTLIYIHAINNNISSLNNNLNAIKTNIATNFTYTNSLIKSINHTEKDVNLTILENLILEMNTTLQQNINGIYPYLYAINAQTTFIELKLDCNYTVNKVCDKLDDINIDVDNINDTINNIYNLLLSFNGGCIWIADYLAMTSCETNDTQIAMKIYYEINSCGTSIGLPFDNGTIVIVSCNYCSENIIQEKTVCESGFQTYSYYDANYNDCCLITGLYSDCLIIYGNYTNITFDCSQKVQCQYNTNPFLKSKLPFSNRDIIDFYCLINLTGNYSCVAEVYKDGVLLQTNPDTEAVNMYGIVNTFEGNTPIIRGWYRKGTLLPDTSFQVKMRCSEGPDIATNEFQVNPKYKSLDFNVDKMLWIKRNWGYLFAIFGVFCFVLIIVYVIRGKR